MNFRLATLLAHESIATAGTKTLDLTLKDLISKINIQVKATNNLSVPTAHPSAIISKIEVVDGSDVIFSLSGKECLALQFYCTKKTPLVINNYLDNTMNIVNYEIYFGRFLYDTMLAFDPTKFNNPQIKVTHNLANGGAAPDACTLEITAEIFDEKTATPQGFLMSKENVSYTLVANGNEYVDIPVDHTFRNIIIMSHANDKMPWQQFNEVKLSEDNDRRVPIDDKTSDLLKYLGAQYPSLDEYIEGVALITTRVFYVMSTYEIQFAAIAMGFAAGYLTSDYPYGGNIDIRGSVTCNFKALVKGMAPFGALIIPFGDQQDLDDWYKVAEIGSLRLTLKAGSSPGANSTCEVITQQLRPYA